MFRFLKTLATRRQGRASALKSTGRSNRKAHLCLESLEERTVMNVDFSQLQSQLPGVLSNLQSAVTQDLKSAPLPLVGSGFTSDPAAQIVQTIESNLVNYMKAHPVTTQQQALDALNSLFPAGSNNVKVVKETDGVEFQFQLAGTASASDPFNLGLPSLGLTATGKVKVALTYQLNLDIGLSVDSKNITHLYLDTTPAPELTLGFDVTIPNSLVAASFGPLTVMVGDGAFPPQIPAEPWTKSAGMKPSEFKGTFTFDVTGPSSSNHRLDATAATPGYFLSNTAVGLNCAANVDLAAEVSVNGLPSMALNLEAAWNFNGNFTTSNVSADVPTVQFDDVQMDVGSLLATLKPYMKELNLTLTPIDSVVQTLTAPLPVLSDLAGHSISLEDLAKVVQPGLGALDPFVNAFKSLYHLSGNVPTVAPGTVIVDFGSFDLGGADPRSASFDPTKITPHVILSTAPAKQQIQSKSAAAFSYIYDPTNGLEGSLLGTLGLPFLDSPTAIFQTMLSQNVTLLTYTMPPLNAPGLFHFDQSFPILGPISVRLQGDINVQASASFGFDTYGLINNLGAQDGFYISQASASMQGKIEAGLILDIPVFQPYVGGGVVASVHLGLVPAVPDPKDPSGKIRFNQLQTESSTNAMSVFTMPAGQLDAYLDAGVRIGVDTPFGFLGVDFNKHLADKVLLNFNFVPTPQPVPVLAHFDPSNKGSLILNLGQFEKQRIAQTADTTEVFEVSHLSGTRGNETVAVTAYNVTQTFAGVSSLAALGSNNNETITFDANVLDDANVTSGTGNNTLSYQGSGNATFSVGGGVGIGGGSGINKLSGGQGTNTFVVSSNGGTLADPKSTIPPNDNELIGGTGTNVLTFNGNGVSTLTAGGGNDQLKVTGNGTNLLIAGKGHDAITIGTEQSSTSKNAVSWQVGDGPLTILAFDGQNTLEVAGSAGPDTFTVDPINTKGVKVTADGVAITANSFIQSVAIDSSGADSTTVNDLGALTQVQQVGVNLGQAASPNKGADVTTVNGNTDSHFVTVATEGVWKEPPAHGSDTPLDAGVMMVRTRTGYRVNVAAVNTKDEVIVNAKGIHNQINVQSNTAHTVINTEFGSDSFLVGNDSAPNNGQLYYVPPATANKLLFGLPGQLDLHAGPGSNSLTVTDSKDATGSNLTLTNATITGSAGNISQLVAINYSAVPSGNWSGGITLKTGPGKDVIALQSTPNGATVSLLTGGGGDQITIGDSALTLNSIRGPVDIDGGDSTPTVTFDDTGAAAGRTYLLTAIMGTDHVISQNTGSSASTQDFSYQHVGKLVLNADNHGNTFDVPAAGAAVDLHTGNGTNSILLGDATNGNHLGFTQPLSIDGQNGSNQLAVNDQGTTTGALTYTLDAASVQASDAGKVSYSHVQQLTLSAGSGTNNIVSILGTAAGTTYQVNAGAGNSASVGLGNFLTSLAGFQGSLTLNGQGGSKALNIYDLAATTPEQYVVAAAEIDRGGSPVAHYQGFSSMTLNTGKGSNTVTIQSTVAGTPIVVNGGSGINTLVGPSSANTWDVTGPNAGTLHGAPSLVTFNSMTNLTGGAGTDAFRIHNGGSISGNIDGGAGSNTLDYSAYVGDVTADLLLKQATGVKGQVTNVPNVTGSTGNDILVGGGQAGILHGGTGRNILIAEAGASQLFGGGGDDILIAGKTTYDTNLAAIDQIMSEWTRSTPVASRIHDIMAGGGLNGSFRLFAGSGGTVTSNLQTNNLTDGAGTDWLFLRTAVDKHFSAKSSDVIASL